MRWDKSSLSQTLSQSGRKTDGQIYWIIAVSNRCVKWNTQCEAEFRARKQYEKLWGRIPWVRSLQHSLCGQGSSYKFY